MVSPRRFLAALLLAAIGLAATPARAGDIVTSPAPDRVSVSIYRAPDRDPDSAMELRWLRGYALVTETRTVVIPAGRATIRFEGVAAGMLPESAIVTGLPSGVREKNLDADLLSPGALYARAFGRPIILRRTHPRTGKVIEERAVIRSGPDGGIIVQTKAGFEAAKCGPLNDALIYPDIPADLSARPTLSVETEAAAGARVTLTLSYLAWGFDWQANYVVRMRPDGRQADLSAWVTLASSDSTSFADAETAVIAGKVSRESRDEGVRPQGADLVYRCFLTLIPSPAVVMPQAAPAPAPVMMAEAADIVVTSQRRAITVQREELGDLKLYRVPFPTTVAAQAQKQVALADKPGVKVAVVYRSDVYGDSLSGVRMMLRTRNRAQEGLGLPLPGGPVAVFEPHGTAMLLAGEGGMADRAVGEDVEITFGTASGVWAEATETASGEGWQDVEILAGNSHPWPVKFEARIAFDDDVTLEKPSSRLGRKDGRPLWAPTIPANGTARLRYRLRDVPETE